MAQDGKQVKILTVGPPCGRIEDLLGKVKAINNKYGPFDALFVLGDLFKPAFEGSELMEEEENLLNGNLISPIPIYFIQPPSPLHSSIRKTIIEKGNLDETTFDSDSDQSPIKINDSLYFLGKSGVTAIPSKFQTGKSIRIAVLGGYYDNQSWQENVGKEESILEGLMNPHITPSSLDRLLSHPSFQSPPSSHPISNNDESEPTTLAAAKAKMAKRNELLENQAKLTSKPPIDVLLTNDWPSNITMFSNPEKLPHLTCRVWGTPILGNLLAYGQPRYHFALAPGSCGDIEDGKNSQRRPFGIVGLDGTEEGEQLRKVGAFWEREPFRNEGFSNPLCNVTRFISLARFGNAKKERWFMALNLVPADSVEAKMINKEPPGTTLSPYSANINKLPDSGKRKGIEEEEMQSGQNYRWIEKQRPKKQQRAERNNGSSQMKGLPNKPDGPLPDRPNKQKVLPVGPQDCWFCLSNPQCAKHLIVAIGTECYVAMPKGQLPPTSHPHSVVPGGGHVLIIPIEHFPSLLGHPDSSTVKPIAKEMEDWRNALRKVYASFDAIMVSWEICRTIGSRAGHMQCQALPVPRRLFEDGDNGSGKIGLEEYFRQAALSNGYDLIEDQEKVRRMLEIGREDVVGESDYFRLDLNDKVWFMSILPGKRFNLQFPRQTLANFLGIPDRADWKKCARSDTIETAETNAFKSAFEPYAEAVE